jgi:hypothetical protein
VGHVGFANPDGRNKPDGNDCRRINRRIGGDMSTASSDFSTGHDGLVSDSSQLSALTAPTGYQQTQDDIVAAINTCATAAGDAQTGADNTDASMLQTAADEMITCNSQIQAANSELQAARGQ